MNISKTIDEPNEETQLITFRTKKVFYRLACPKCAGKNIVDFEKYEEINEALNGEEITITHLFKNPVICMDCFEVFGEEDPLQK